MLRVRPGTRPPLTLGRAESVEQANCMLASVAGEMAVVGDLYRLRARALSFDNRFGVRDGERGSLPVSTRPKGYQRSGMCDRRRSRGGATYTFTRPANGLRILHPPSDDSQPDHPRKAEGPGQQDQRCVRS
jgi:hypothetical protein